MAISIKRSASPPANRSRKQSIINNIPAPEHHQMLTFPQFSYDNGLSAFTLQGMGEESPTEACPPSMYPHHPPSSYQLNTNAHSGFSSPTSNHSSPSPYGDFNAFPLSPPSTGTTLSSLITQPHNPSHHGPLAHQLPHQPLSPTDLSSAISRNGTFEITCSGHSCSLPNHPHNRRESYPTAVNDPAYGRRNSTLSVGSLRSLQSSSPYPAYASLGPQTSAQSQIYTLAEDLSSHGVFYMDSGCHTVPPPSPMTSSVMQTEMMAETPRLSQSQIPQMVHSAPPPSKLATRQYRKKTPPEVCAVCPARETPEWRKGPSGLRTLCNACGLTAAKLSLGEPTCIEDVWAQLIEIGRIRYRKKFVFEEHKKKAAAQTWTSQSHNGGRSGNGSRYSYSASASSPSARSSRTSFSSMASPTARTTSNRNPAEIDAAQQLFCLSRARENGLNGAISGDQSVLSSPNVGHLQSYSSPSHAASLRMGSSSESDHGLTDAFSTHLSSPMYDSTERMLEMYNTPIHSDNSRRDSIGGHRMAISSIVNQDPNTLYNQL